MTLVNRATFQEHAPRRYRIGFLFNHESAHQVAHSAPIASQLALSDPAADVAILGTSDDIMQRAWALCAPEARPRIWFEKLGTPAWRRPLAAALDALLPFSRLANLIQFREQLALFDVLVVPERTSLFLRTLLGNRVPLLVHTKHGSGDRAQGYKAIVNQFDLVLVSGQKVRDRLVNEARVPAEKCAVVGYAKFDTLTPVPRQRFFGNDNPTVVYNPHPEPGLSSWFDMGLKVLDYFSQQNRFNLIFAPHVMLFQRKLHIGLDARQIRWRGRVPRRFFACDNILIDTDSPRLLDMTYTTAADIYLGDVSSQVYEFLLKPRPMVFLNPGRKVWRNDPNYHHWAFGPVASDIASLDAALRDCVVNPERYRAAQQRGFRYTFDLTTTSSSLRAARAVAQFARREFAQQSLAGKGHAVNAAGRRVHAV